MSLVRIDPWVRLRRRRKMIIYASERFLLLPSARLTQLIGSVQRHLIFRCGETSFISTIRVGVRLRQAVAIIIEAGMRGTDNIFGSIDFSGSTQCLSGLPNTGAACV